MTDRIKAMEDVTDPHFIWEALDSVYDGEASLDDYAAAVSRAQRAALAAIQPAQPVAVKVKPLVWGPYPNPVFAGPEVSVANVSGSVISYYYQAGRNPDAPGYYVFAAPTHGTLQWRNDGHASIEAAKAAAQADYEARIMAALDVQPLTVQDAARVVDDGLADGDVSVIAMNGARGALRHIEYYLTASEIHDALTAALRAIAEGRA